MFSGQIDTPGSHVNDPTILAPKQPKVAVFDKTDFLGYLRAKIEGAHS